MNNKMKKALKKKKLIQNTYKTEKSHNNWHLYLNIFWPGLTYR